MLSFARPAHGEMILSDNLIEVRDVRFSRGPRSIFRDLNLTIREGDVTAIMGPSG